MKGYIGAQSIVFGDFSNYNIDSQNIYELMGKMKEFEVIPNVIDEIQFEIKENKPMQRAVKRLDLVSIKEAITVIISQHNISVQAIPKVDLSLKTSEIDIDAFIFNTKNIFEILFSIMNIKANRVSLVTTYLNEDNLMEQYEKYVNPNGFFKDKDVFEWNNRSVIRDVVEDINNDEINIVYNISRLKGVLGTSLPIPNEYSFDGVIKEIDINTVPENMELRIDSNYMKSFYDIAISKKKEVEGMVINNE